MRLGTQLLELLLDLRALAADVFEATLIVLELLLERLGTLGEKRETGNGKREYREHDRLAHHVSRFPFLLSRLHTRRKCRPTLAELPKNPISVPNATIADACSREKNAAWKSQRLISV